VFGFVRTIQEVHGLFVGDMAMKRITSSKAVQAKKKKKGPFTYKGKKYKTNPWAACSKNIDRKKEPEKHERCVRHVKDSSEI